MTIFIARSLGFENKYTLNILFLRSIRLVRVKAYKPPIGIEEQIKNIVLEEYEKEAQVNTDNFKQIKLDNQTKRFNVYIENFLKTKF